MRDSSVNFDRAADYYDATRGFPEGEDVNAARFLAEVADLPANARVLEIGIGTGRIALPYSRFVGDYYGIDISAKMLERLHHKQTDEPVYVSVGDAMRLPFADDTFDAVVIVHVLHLVKDPTAVLNEVQRVLKTDGIVLKCNNRFGTAGEKMDALRDAWMDATRVTREKGDAWSRVDSVMPELDWVQAKPPQEYKYNSTVTPKHFVDLVEGRRWSNTWDMPDDIWQAGVNAVKAGIEEHFAGNANTAIQQDAGFVVEVYKR